MQSRNLLLMHAARLVSRCPLRQCHRNFSTNRMVIIHDHAHKLVDYNLAVKHQIRLRERLLQEPDEPHHLLLLQHTPVFTCGVRTEPKTLLDTGNVPVIQSARGGSVTFHGPGQLVAYPVLHLKRLKMSVKDFMHGLEQAIIRTLKDFDVDGRVVSDAPGVWVGDSKIAAIGVKMSRFVSIHGIIAVCPPLIPVGVALNVDPDMSYFRRIVPCGLDGRGVTCLAQILGNDAPSIAVVSATLTQHLTSQFGISKLMCPKESTLSI